MPMPKRANSPSSETSAESVSEALLAWYDSNARVLPWRVPPQSQRRGERPDPYVVWLSEIMLQQTHGCHRVFAYFEQLHGALPRRR